MAKMHPGRCRFARHEGGLHGVVSGANLTGNLQGRIAGRTGVRQCQRPGRLLQEAGAAQQAGSEPSAQPAQFHARLTPRALQQTVPPDQAGFVATKFRLDILSVNGRARLCGIFLPSGLCPKKGVWNSPSLDKWRSLERLKVPDTFFWAKT